MSPACIPVYVQRLCLTLKYFRNLLKTFYIFILYIPSLHYTYTLTIIHTTHSTYMHSKLNRIQSWRMEKYILIKRSAAKLKYENSCMGKGLKTNFKSIKVFLITSHNSFKVSLNEKIKNINKFSWLAIYYISILYNNQPA